MLGDEVYCEGRADRTSTGIHEGQAFDRRRGRVGEMAASFLNRETW